LDRVKLMGMEWGWEESDGDEVEMGRKIV